jgi:hypothetical protein
VRHWAPTAIVIALLGATAVAFATTERQKLEKTPVAVVHVDRSFSPKRTSATIRLRLRHPHLLTVEILDSRERPVAALVRERRVEAGFVEFHWHATARDGLYTPRITIDNGREIPLPQIRVDSVLPTATLVAYRPHVLRKRAKPKVAIAYRLSEKAHVIVYVNGRRDVIGGAKGLKFKVDWIARRFGVRLRPGRYRLQLAAVDLAGNIGPRTAPFVVRIR